MTSEIKVGSEYVFSGRHDRGEFLRGEVVEVVDGGKVARVKLTRSANVPNGPVPSEPGEILRVYLPMMRWDGAN